MIDLELSFSRDEAVAHGLLFIDPGAKVAPSIRIVPREDDGREFGPVTIGAETIVRDGVILSTGTVIGRKCLVGFNCALRRRVTMGDESVLSHLVSVQHDVKIGRLVRISSLTHITGGTLIEDRVQIGAGVATVDDNALQWPHPEALVPPTFRFGCRVGSGVTVLSGVEIGRNSLIGAGSVVTRNIPENVIAFGNPAYVQRDRSPRDILEET